MTDSRPRHVPAAGLRWRQWGDELVVFHPGTAETHLVVEPRASVLRVISDTPGGATLEDIVAAFGGIVAGGAGFSAEEFVAVDAMIAELAQLGLVDTRA